MPTDKKSKKSPGRVANVRKRISSLRSRRPHKSFQLTRRRDIPKHAPLPGYFSFTAKVFGTLKKYKRYYFVLLGLYVVTAALLIGVSQQEQYRLLVESLQDYGQDFFGSLDGLATTMGIFGLAISGGFNASLNESQQLYVALAVLLLWLVVVWLLRQLMAGNKVRVRDALYNGTAPFISTMLITLLMLVQALPAAVGVLIFGIASQDSAMTGAVAMLFGVGALLLMLMSLYWLTSSIFALLIVTLPGTYPMAAIRAAGDLAIGRRISLILRLIWMAAILLIIWVIVLVPVLILDNWLNIGWSPLVLLTMQILTGVSLLFGTTYVYLLYREMINEPAK